MKSFRAYVEETANSKDARLENITTQILSPTGFMYLDYMNGIHSVVYDENEKPLECFHNVGVMYGSVNTIIAKSGVGKTTIALKMAAGIIEPWIKNPILSSYINPDCNPNFNSKDFKSLIQVADIEKTLEISNVKRISRYPNKILKNNIEINQISTDEELIKLLDKHVKFKVDNMKKLYMPIRDIYGDYVYTYPPTVMIVDSMSKLSMKDTEEIDNYDKGTNNTAGARRAKIISHLYSLFVDYAKKYNIIIFSINHINVKPQMGFLPTPKQYRGLKQDETLGNLFAHDSLIAGTSSESYLLN